MSATNLAKLQRAQNKACRAVTGLYHSTPEEWVRWISGVESVETLAKRRTIVAVEKSMRLKEGNPRRQTLEKEVKMRESNKRKG